MAHAMEQDVMRAVVAGVGLEFQTGESGFSRFVRDSFHQAIVPKDALERLGGVDLKVEVEFMREGASETRSRIKEITSDNPIILGDSIFRGDNSVLYSYGPYFIQVRRENSRVEVKVIFRMTKRFRIARSLKTDELYEHYLELMRRSIQFPIFQILEHRGFTLLHASATKGPDSAVLFMGLNGSGKTSSALALTPEMNLISDNFVLFDGRNIIGFPEMIRIPQDSPLAHDAERHRAVAFGRIHIRNDLAMEEMKSIPGICIVCQKGPSSRWEPIDKSEAIRYLEATDRFLQEGHLYSYLTFFDEGSYARMYPDCPYFLATLGEIHESRKMIRQEVGELLGLRL